MNLQEVLNDIGGGNQGPGLFFLINAQVLRPEMVKKQHWRAICRLASVRARRRSETSPFQRSCPCVKVCAEMPTKKCTDVKD